MEEAAAVPLSRSSVWHRLYSHCVWRGRLFSSVLPAGDDADDVTQSRADARTPSVAAGTREPRDGSKAAGRHQRVEAGTRASAQQAIRRRCGAGALQQLGLERMSRHRALLIVSHNGSQTLACK